MNRRVLTVGVPCVLLCGVGWLSWSGFQDPVSPATGLGGAATIRPAPPALMVVETGPAPVRVSTPAEVDAEVGPMIEAGLRFSGRVVDHDGVGVPGCWVGVRPYIGYDYSDGSEPAPPQFDQGVTDERGRFEIVVADPDSYGGAVEASAVKDGFGVARHHAENLRREEPHHDLGDIVLPVGYVLSGIVVDASGSPLAGAELFRSGRVPPLPAGAPCAISDAHGRFELPHVEVEKIRVGARLSGYAMAGDFLSVAVPAGGLAEPLTITMLQTRPVEVTIRLGPTARGPRNTHVRVMWDAPSGERAASVFATDAELPDPIIVENVPADAPGLRAVALNGWYGQTALVAAAPGSRRIALEFDPANQVPCLDIQVIDDASGRPVTPDLIVLRSWTAWEFGATSGPFLVESASWGRQFRRSYPAFGPGNLPTYTVAPGHYRVPYEGVYSATCVDKYGPPPYAVSVEANGYATACSPIRFLSGSELVVEPWVLRLTRSQ